MGDHFPEQNKSFSKENKRFSGENKVFSKERDSFSLENKWFSEENKVFSLENNVRSERIKESIREYKVVCGKIFSFYGESFPLFLGLFSFTE